MTVTTLRQSETSPTPHLTCRWVPMLGADGRTRMEQRWGGAPSVTTSVTTSATTSIFVPGRASGRSAA